MTLCTPQVRGLLSEWSADLLIEGALPGATVLARIGGPGGRLVVKAAAGGGRDRLPLLPGEALNAGERVFVQQSRGGEDSPWTKPELVAVVGAAPTSHEHLAPLAFVSRLFECSARVWVGGAVPGSRVTVSRQGAPLGAGIASEEGARLQLTAALGSGNVVAGSQAAPPGRPPLAGPPAVTQGHTQALPVPFGGRLPEPELRGPTPRGCDPALPIGGILDGALVIVRRVTEGSQEQAEFDAESLWFVLSEPLDAGGGWLEVTQSMPERCGRLPSPPLSIRFDAAQPPPLPGLPAPCAGSSLVHVTDLEPGALAHITIGAQEYLGVAPPEAREFTFEVTPIPVDATISVWQERCGLPSGAATVSAVAPGAATAPEVVGRLYACARVVRVRKVTPGAWLRVWARDLDGATRPIGERVRSHGDSVQIAVTPYLAEGQIIWASQLACGGPWLDSGDLSVEPTPPIEPPVIVEPAIAGDSAVLVEAIPGAFVEIFVEDRDGRAELIGTGHVDPDEMAVPLLRRLRHPEQVYARQSLCATVSRSGPGVDVLMGEKVFTLDKAKKRLMLTKDVVWASGILTVHHDGTFLFEASVENKETKADCSIDLQVTLAFKGPSKFGAVIATELGSPGNDVGAQLGRAAVLNAPPARTVARSGHFAAFQDPDYWLGVLATTAKFEWFPAMTSYVSDKPKDPKAPEPKPKSVTP